MNSLENTNHKMDILYAGTLPPHQGGSAISGFQLIKTMAGKGCTIRAVGPATPETIDEAGRFDASHPEIGFKRFEMPFYRTSPDLPVSDDYWESEGSALTACLTRMCDDRRPDLILLGRETYSWCLPHPDTNETVAYALRVAGGTLGGIMKGNYAREAADRLVKQFRAVDEVIVPGRHLVEPMQAFGCDRVSHVPNAIDVAAFSPEPADPGLLRELRIDRSRKVIMHISNLKPVKRSLDFVRAAIQALAKSPGLMFVVVGHGSTRPEMERTCREHGIQNSFRFTGWVDYGQMPRYIRIADAVVMCSDSEGLARVYLETQSCGRVLIASDIPAAREVIVDRRHGLLFPAGDHSALAARILEAMEDRDLRLDLGHRARRRVVECHSLDAAAEAYIRIFRGAVERAPRPDGVRPVNRTC